MDPMCRFMIMTTVLIVEVYDRSCTANPLLLASTAGFAPTWLSLVAARLQTIHLCLQTPLSRGTYAMRVRSMLVHQHV